MDDFPFVVATLVSPHGVFEVRSKTEGDYSREIADAISLADGVKTVVLNAGLRLVPLGGTFRVPKAVACMTEASAYGGLLTYAEYHAAQSPPDAPHIATEG